MADLGELARRFEFDGRQLPLDAARSHNFSPTRQALTVREGGEGRQDAPMRWGLIPSWTKAPAAGNRMINARAETVAKKPAFRSDATSKRNPRNFWHYLRSASGDRPEVTIQCEESLSRRSCSATMKTSAGEGCP